MSDAQTAWEEYGFGPNPLDGYGSEIHAAFLAGFAAGQVQALEDAADDDFLRLRAEGFIKFEQNPTPQRVQSWLHARAAQIRGGTGHDRP